LSFKPQQLKWTWWFIARSTDCAASTSAPTSGKKKWWNFTITKTVLKIYTQIFSQQMSIRILQDKNREPALNLFCKTCFYQSLIKERFHRSHLVFSLTVANVGAFLFLTRFSLRRENIKINSFKVITNFKAKRFTKPGRKKLDKNQKLPTRRGHPVQHCLFYVGCQSIHPVSDGRSFRTSTFHHDFSGCEAHNNRNQHQDKPLSLLGGLLGYLRCTCPSTLVLCSDS